MCERLLGVVAGATTDARSQFSEADLQLLTGIAAMAAGGLRNLDDLEALSKENERLQDSLQGDISLVGDTDAMRSVRSFIAKAAPSAATILITGESGTGKELVARAIHRNSPRSSRPFIAINCATLTDQLLESELFGHEKGAFTGAVVQKRGKLEEAHTGTIFLDEIGELPPLIQAKLLRVLQEREFERVGGTRPIRVDVRVVTATNRNLAEMVKSGTFRSDLFYRINVVAVQTPSLRNRRPDIPLLIAHFLKKHGETSVRRIGGVSRQALECLKQYDWPGNVRELENAIERAVVLGSTEIILPDDLPEDVLEASPGVGEADSGTFHDLVNDAKRRIIASAMEQAGGQTAKAARLLGIHPNNLHRLTRNLQVRGKGKGN